MRKTLIFLVVLMLAWGICLLAILMAGDFDSTLPAGKREAVIKPIKPSFPVSAPPLVNQFPSPDGATRGLAFDGTYLWSADNGDGNSVNGDMIYKLDPNTGLIINSYLPPGGSPCGLAWDGQYLWLSDFGTDMIYKLNPVTLAVVSSFAAPTGSPRDLAWHNGYLYLAQENDTIVKINPNTGAVVQTIVCSYSTPNVRPFGLTFIPQGAAGELWTSDGNYGSNYVNEYDLLTGVWNDQWLSDPATYPCGLAYDPASGYLWVSCWDTDMIYVFDVGGGGVPDISINPLSFNVTLPVGGSTGEILTISNLGTAGLQFNITEQPAKLSFNYKATSSNYDHNFQLSDREMAERMSTKERPESFSSQAVTPNIKLSANGNRVLLFKDVNPWQTTSNEDALTALGISYDLATSAQMATADLDLYDVVIIASDQPQSFYDVFDANLSRFSNYVSGGKVLEFHGCDNGWESGFWNILPGGTTHERCSDDYNYIADPSHPIVAGLTDADLVGSSASHDHFLTLPGSTTIITTDDVGLPTTIEYPFGSGTVIATCMTYEFAYDRAWGFAPMLSNTITYALSLSGMDVPWLSEMPTTGNVPPGGNMVVDINFDATGMAVGTYYADLLINSNDPDEPVVVVPVTMNVTGECPPPYIKAGDASGIPGDSIVVEISVLDNPTPIDAFGFKFSFCADKLIYGRVMKGTLTQGFSFFQGNETVPGEVMIGGFDANAIPAYSDGTIAEVVLYVDQCNEGETCGFIVSDLTDDLIGLNNCGGIFSCEPGCWLGDVNMDGVVTPGDALCAFQIYLNGGTPPPECDNPCALYAADVNCSPDGVTPGDALYIFLAYLAGEDPPLDCNPATQFSASSDVQNRHISLIQNRSLNENELVFSLVIDNPLQLKSFGLDLGFPEDVLEFVEMIPTDLTESWQAFEAKESIAGVLRIGGFNNEAMELSEMSKLADIRFRIRDKASTNGSLWFYNLTDDIQSAEATSFNFSLGPTDVRQVNFNGAITSYALEQNYPNPFNMQTEIEYQLPKNGFVELVIYNMSGQKIRTLVSEDQNAGRYRVRWNGRDDSGVEVSSGVYMYKYKVNDFNQNRKLILIK